MPTPVYWLTRSAADVPLDDAWLAAGEAAHLAGMRVAKRRHDWRLGRWTAKEALAAFLTPSRGLLSSPPASQGAVSARRTAAERLEIRAAADGAPEAFLDGKPLEVAISFSHSGGRALCAVAAAGAALGCDLEAIEERSAAFVRDYFTAGERGLLAGGSVAERPLLANLLWSAKESAMKALRTGLRLDTRTVEVSLRRSDDPRSGDPRSGDPARVPAPRSAEPAAASGWRPLEVRRLPAGPTFGGWWRRAGEQVMTVVADPAAAVPVELEAFCASQ